MEKQELCKWTSKALQAPLMPRNIKAWFRKSGIWPLDYATAKHTMKPLARFEQDKGGDSKQSYGASTSPRACLGDASITGQVPRADIDSPRSSWGGRDAASHGKGLVGWTY